MQTSNDLLFIIWILSKKIIYHLEYPNTYDFIFSF